MSSALRLSIVGLMLATAIALGLFAFNLSHPANLSVETTVMAPPPPLQTAYLVAAHALPAGTLLRDEDFRAELTSHLPADAIVDSPAARGSLHGSLIRAFVDAGSAITTGAVLRPRDRGFIASVLQAGTRAVAIGVDPVSGVAGLIWPGDHVDIVLTQEIDKASLGKHTLSETVLTNVRVIAIDQEMVQGAPADSASAGKLVRTITLQVDPWQVEQVAVATHLGKLDAGDQGGDG